MKKICFLFVAVMSLLAVGCRDVLLEKNIGGFSVSFQTPGSSATRAGTTAMWKLEAWLELESGAQLQKKEDTVPANAPITISFDAIAIGTKLKVQVRLEDSENELVQYEGSSDWITVDAEAKTVAVQVQRTRTIVDIAQSGVVLWKRNEDSGNDTLYTAPYGKYESPALLTDAQSTELNFDAGRQVYCFDKNGNLYVQPASSTTVSDVLKFEIQSDSSYTAGASITTGGQIFSHLAYDNVAEVLYGIGERASLHYCKSGEASFTEVLGGDTVNGGSYLGLAAYNNVAYVAETGLSEGDNGEIVVSLSRYNLSSGGSQKMGETIGHQLPTVFGTDASTLTGQMICQDGALYLSIGSIGFLSGIAGYSVGAVIKINAETLAIESSFGKDGYLGLLTSARQINNVPQCYAPTEENDNAYFYGPMGFVAVMPKKLVIADSGFAMSDGSGQVNLSKKRRIVTVDLETEAFSSVAVEDYYDPTYTPASGFDVVN